MKVTVINNGQVHEFVGQSTVIVKDNAGNVVSVAAETGVPGTFVVSHVEDPKFNDIVRSLGIDRTVFVKKSKLLLPGQMPVH